MITYSQTDLEMCKDSIFYLLSLSCKGKFCKDCKHSKSSSGSCLKGDLRDIIGMTHPRSTELQTLADVYILIDSIKQSVAENCNLSGVWCKSGCPFYMGGRCKRIEIRERLKNENI